MIVNDWLKPYDEQCISHANVLVLYNVCCTVVQHNKAKVRPVIGLYVQASFVSADINNLSLVLVTYKFMFTDVILINETIMPVEKVIPTRSHGYNIDCRFWTTAIGYD